jgi:hypothetical protein
MSKSLFVILIALFVLSASASSLDQIKNIYQNDKCVTDELDLIKPMIQEKITILKANKNDIVAKTDLITLVRQLQSKIESCGTLSAPKLGDAVEATGIAFLLASNCFKDVGIVFLIADDIVQDASDITNDIIVTIIVGILGYQGYKDCSQFINFIIG